MPLSEPTPLTSFFETRLNFDTYAISRSQSLATGISPIRVDEHTSNVNVISKWIHVNGFAITTTDTTDCVQGKVSQRRSISTGKYRSREDEEPSAGSDNNRRHFHSIGGRRSPPSLSSTSAWPPYQSLLGGLSLSIRPRHRIARFVSAAAKRPLLKQVPSIDYNYMVRRAQLFCCSLAE
jgi:hypothetical protein